MIARKPVAAPLPGSTWLVFSSAVLFGRIVIQESTELAGGWKDALAAFAPPPARLKPTTSAPPPFRKLRRENSRFNVLAIPTSSDGPRASVLRHGRADGVGPPPTAA